MRLVQKRMGKGRHEEGNEKNLGQNQNLTSNWTHCSDAHCCDNYCNHSALSSSPLGKIIVYAQELSESTRIARRGAERDAGLFAHFPDLITFY